MLAVIGSLVLVWLGVVAFRLGTAAVDARRGVLALERVSERSTGDLGRFVGSVGQPDDPDTEAVMDDLATASDAFRSAHDSAGSALVAPLRLVPVLGRQVRSVAAMSGAAATAASASQTAFSQLAEIAAEDSSTPQDRLDQVNRTREVLAELDSTTSSLDLGPKDGLIGPLARAYDRFDAELTETRGTVTRALAGATGVDRFLTGPSRYLVLAANNAEMRAGSGMFLQAGELTASGGQLELSDMQPTARMVLDTPGTTLDPDVAALWDWMDPAREWRSLNATPRFDQSARMAADMWAASGNPPVDGVVALDLVGLQRLLELVGSVDVVDTDGRPMTVTADNVLSEMLLKQYLGSDTVDERRDQLSVVAQAVFRALNERGYEPGQLLAALQSAGRGRHLMMWSNDPVEQAGWEALDASGALPRDALLLSVLNRGGNKLDQFLRVTADMTWTEGTGSRRVSVAITATNTTPAGLPRFVAGPFPGLDTEAGEYRGVVALTIPKTATAPAAEGAELFLSGEDGPTRLIAVRIALERGESSTVTLSFDIPARTDPVVVLPSARVPPVVWSAGGDTWKDRLPHQVQLGG